MPLLKQLQSHPFLVFFMTLILALIVSTQVYYKIQLAQGNPPDILDVLDDRQKALMSEEQDLSKWLLGIASGALTATLLTRMSAAKSTNETDASIATMIAWACLIVSMYCGFLSYQMKLSILQRGPLDSVYSRMFLTPTLLQIYSLVAGLLALGWGVFRRPKVLATVAVACALSLGTRAHSQSFDQKKCVTGWYMDRLQVEADPAPADRYLTALAKKIPVSDPGTNKKGSGSAIANCNDVDVVMDQVRFRIFASTNKEVTANSLNAFLATNQPDLEGPAASMGDLAVALIGALMPWGKPFGTLSFRVLPPGGANTPVYRVFLGDSLVGSTPLMMRVKPDTYRISVLPKTGLNPVWSSDSYSIKDGESKTVALPVKP